MKTSYLSSSFLLGRILVILTCVFYSLASNGESIRYSANVFWENGNIEEIDMGNQGTYTYITFPNSIHNISPGKPDIPYIEYEFLVPDGAGNFKTVIHSVKIQGETNLLYPLMPSQLSWSNNDVSNKPFLGIDNDSYSDGESSPKAVIMDEIYLNSRFHIVKVGIPIMEYSYHSKLAKLYSEVEVALEYETEVSPRLSIGGEPTKEDYESLMERVVNLPEHVLINTFSDSSQLPSIFSQGYYIITPQCLLSSASQIGEWKKQKGHNVKVITVEEILATEGMRINGTTIVDEAESIRKWLIAERQKVGSFYLLMIGDSRVLSPMRKLRYGSRYDTEENKVWSSGQFIPTDGYFSDLTTNYNLTKEEDGHYSAYVEKVSYSPDLWVGRLLVSKNEEIERYYKKLLTYELLPNNKNGRYSYLNNGLVTQQYQHKNYSSLFNNVSSFPNVTVLQDIHGYTDYTLSTPTGEEVINAMGKCGLISLMGHGGPTSIACSGGNNYPEKNPITGKYVQASEDWRYIQPLTSYGPEYRWIKRSEANNGFDLLANSGKPGVIYTLSCDVIPFDSLFNGGSGSALPYNMGEAYTVAGDFGGVAFIGNTRTGWDYNTKLMEAEFGRQLYKRVTLGEALKQSSRATTYRYAQYSRNLIGDPDIMVWIGEPSKLNLETESSSTMANISGLDLENSKIVVYNGVNSTSFNAGFGISKVSFYKQDYGNDFLISVYKDDHSPYLYLYAENSVLSRSKKYILTETSLTGTNNYCYRINNNGVLYLNCLENFKSNKGFEINNGGLLNIECTGHVILSKDNVNYGGRVDIKANKVELLSGFSINTGGNIEIKCL